MAPSLPSRLALPAASAALGLAVVLPLLAPGFVLTYDMVFVPRPELSLELLGVSRTLPRSVPSALLVALASRAFSGQLVQKLVLLGIFAGGAYGAARLVPSRRPAARLAGGVLYAWNPFTYERLLLGHWALLLGYAVLPGVAGAALRLRRGEARAGPRLVLWLAAATAPSPYTGLLAAVVAGAVALWPPAGAGTGRRAGAVVGGAVLTALPWLVPALLHPGIPERPALAVELFGARSDSPLGTVGSLLSLGGLWRTDLAPPGRDGLAWLPAFALIGAVTVVGFRALARRWPPGAARGLLALAAVGLLLAAAPALPGVEEAVRWLAGAIPGGGILRESQKFVVPLALLGAVGFGLGVERVLDRAEAAERVLVRWLAVPLALLPVALAPTLAWGAGGRLLPVDFPPSWDRAADPVEGAVLLLPWHTFLPFSWNEGRTVHEPATAWFARPVVAASSLEIGPYELPHEDPWSRLADRVVDPERSSGPIGPHLGALGVRYVVLAKEAEWRSFAPRLERLEPVLDAPDLALFRAPPPAPPPQFRRPPAAPVVAADAVALAGLALAAVRSRSSVGAGPSHRRPGILRWRR